MVEYKSYARELKLVAEPAKDYHNIKITKSRDAADFARNFYHSDITIYESFFIILLNRANNTIGHAKISQGGVVGTVIDVKIIAKYAVESLACGMILVHNHPSGNERPSDADISLTRTIKNALMIFDVAVCDHIILTENEHYSLADNGQLY